MNYLTVFSAITLLTASGLSATTAKADMHYGPVRNGDQCWTYSINSLHSEYGYWGQCPSTSSTPAAAPSVPSAAVAGARASAAPAARHSRRQNAKF